MKRVLVVCANILVGLAVVFGLSGLDSVNAVAQTLVPLDSSGAQGNGQLCGAQLAASSDGRYIAFSSTSSDLVPGDTNGVCDVFVRDTQTGTTTRESVSTSGVQADKQVNTFFMTKNGRYLLFTTKASNLADGTTTSSDWTSLYMRDTLNNSTQLVAGSFYSNPDYANYDFGTVSEDGRFVYYRETGYPASVQGYFVKDMLLGTNTRVDAAADGTPANAAPNGSISTDCSGRLAVFSSEATNLTSDASSGLFLVDTAGSSHTLKRIASLADLPQITCDGNEVIFTSDDSSLVSGDTNGMADVFKYDVARGTIKMVSTDASGNEYPSTCENVSPGCPSLGPTDISGISMDGRYVSLAYARTVTVGGTTYHYQSKWVKDTYTGGLVQASQSGNNISQGGSVTSDARKLYYTYKSANGQPVRLYVATDYL